MRPWGTWQHLVAAQNGMFFFFEESAHTCSPPLLLSLAQNLAAGAA